jgi:Astacin (Peptidase family M12A)
MPSPIACTPKYLPLEHWVAAAAKATKVNPANRPQVEMLARFLPEYSPTAEHIAAMTTKYWQSGSVTLTVSFLDIDDETLRAKILQHMNAWSQSSNVAFSEVSSGGQVRIATTAGQGHYSYVGTDILSIADGQPTMNLDSFTLDTPDSEYARVVRHEAGHTMGFVHEHMRQELVSLIDPQKAYDYFLQTQGWTQTVVDQQVLTPIEESSLTGTEPADENSIMCYQLPGTITKDGNPILGGLDIDDIDYAFAAKLYPKS